MKVLYLFDGSAFLYRSFFALPPLSTKSGFPTGAIYGFLRSILSILKTEKPSYIAIAFDLPAPTQKKLVYSEYKSKRPPTPDPLKVQIPVIKELSSLLGIKLVEMPGYEADDLIAYLTNLALERGFNVKIYSPDKDVLQLVEDKKVIVINPVLNEVFDEEKVKEKFGVGPKQLADYLALVGDKTDNIEGIKGVGPKTAISILKKYGSVENILSRWDEFEKAFPQADKEKLRLAYSLVNLRPPEHLEIELEDLKLKNPMIDALKRKLEELEMKSIIKDLEKTFAQKTLF
ncbi:5'-3' exonuclease [Thermocrinis jamiesonii]|jgi:5''-3'' exonuclease (including N-terminal domain of PolI)|uniref:5'-3' exonuclease n=1 Tax=Thermocrinis jamiesonii TaxID=1302351 RepID=UPI000496EF78|nr:5'-3' exonuclease H3TH domain-containing protein [Thermocrinis jamiesonii]